MRLLTERSEDTLADVHLTLLRIVYPGFRFALERRRAGRLCWIAVRRDILTAGLHTIVTDNLDELLAALGPPDPSHEAEFRQPAEVVALYQGITARPGDCARIAPPRRETRCGRLRQPVCTAEVGP